MYKLIPISGVWPNTRHQHNDEICLLAGGMLYL